MAKKQKKPKSGFVVPSDVTPMRLTPELEKAYYVEWKVNGFRCLAHKRGSTVRLYSDQAKEITKAFPTVVKDIRQICDRNFIVDGELVITDEKGHILGRRPLAKFIGALKSGKKVDDSRVHYVYWDVLYFDDKCVMSLEQYERKKLLDDYFRSHGKAHKMPYFIVKNREEARKAIEFVANLDGSEGAIIKRLTGAYSPGKETDAWIKFRVEIELKCVTLGMLPVKGSNAVRHKLGIYVSKKEAKLIDPKYLTELDGKLVLKLGNSFNTSIKAPKGSILKIHVEEVWRHLKGGKYHYSLHKPRVMEVMEEQYATSSLADLDAAVVSRGMEVIEDAELEVQVLRSKAKPDEEGKERMVRDFPKRMQKNFEEVMKNQLWCPCVVQYHYRGHKITDEERELYDIPDKYKWWLRSLHEDVRHWVPAGNVEYEKGERIDWEDPRIKDSYLEGLTVLTPTTTDPKDKDDFYAGSEVAMRGGIRVVTKVIEPCLHPDTFVITNRGFKRAADITKEDLILNRYGHFEQIAYITTGEAQEFYEIKIVGGLPLRVTAQHPFLVAVFDSNFETLGETSHKERELLPIKYRAVWKCASYLKPGDIVLFPKIHLAEVSDDYFGYDKGRIIGKFIADGSLWNKSGISLFFNHRKQNEIEEWIKLLSKFKNKKVSRLDPDNSSLTCTRLSITNRGLRKLAEKCYAPDKLKCIPEEFVKLRSPFTDGLIRGLVEGDGYVRNGWHYLANISPYVIGSLSLMLLGRGIHPSVRLRNNVSTPLRGKIPNRKPIFELKWKEDKAHSHWLDLGDYWGLRVLSVKRIIEPARYYNIATRDTHTICLPFAATHNSGWLYVEGIADVGEPGSTPNAPGVFLIVAKLYYTVHKVSDHILRLEYKSLKGDVNLEWLEKADKQGIYIETQPDKPPKKLKNLDGLWQYQIAHIRPEEWIILLRYLKHNLEQHEIEALDRVVANKDKLGYKADAGQLQDILYYTRQNLTRGEIARRVGLGKRTVLDYQKRLGLL